MSSKKHHSEWLSLVETSGPFLTMPVLEKVFPQGLDAHDPEQYRNLRLAYEEWEEQQRKPVIHRAWIKYVLQQTLGLPDEVLAEGQSIPETIKATAAEHGETLRPDILVRNPADIAPGGQPRLLIQIYPADQRLEKAVEGKHWKASPATRMVELLHASDVKLGLITNGEHWMMVYAPRGETSGFASWYAHLWLEEKLTLQAFVSLLGVSRFFSVPDNETLEAMLLESAKHQQEVTDQLGYQVRRAVEVLIQSLDRADQDNGRALLARVPEAVLYESALTVMMRLVFLFCAEERGLLLLGDEMYDRNYAVSTLVAQLQEAADQHGEEVLERRNDAWVRLLATFRAVFGGVQHERMKLPAYGGKLFNPDRFAFLEGREARSKWTEDAATPLPVNNRTVLHLLRSLQYLEMQGEARRISFEALGIENIGHVYEGLLDHTAKRATQPTLGLIGQRGDEPEIALSELERHHTKGESAWLAYLQEQTSKSESTLRKALAAELDTNTINRLRTACGNDEALFRRVLPLAGVVRNDSFDRPMVIVQGSFYVTAGTDRRSSGTHYTPKSLTEPIVQYTLEPLVYVGPAEGKPKEEWRLRSPRELLELKICDLACGSGAFLVQACRYLSERLVEAWENLARPSESGTTEDTESTEKNAGATDALPKDAGGNVAGDNEQDSTTEAIPPCPPCSPWLISSATTLRITPFGDPATGTPDEALIPLDTNERMSYSQRLIAQRCLYGVDKNPLAVEMAKLSLWLLTLAKDKPFTFLDHAIRCGDSLVGIHHLDQIRYFTLDLDNKQKAFFTGAIEKVANEVIALRQRIEARPADRVEEAEIQQQLLAEAEAKAARLRYAADLLVAVEFREGSARQKEDWQNDAAIQASYYVEQDEIETFKAAAAKAMSGQQTFHWSLEFPEVFIERSGFDAFVCNPPFIGGKKITGNLGTSYRDYLVAHLARGARGNADLSAYFFLQAKRLLRTGGTFGMLATNTIAQGDTREVGLDQIVATGGVIYRAVPSRAWPGVASLEIAEVWLRNGGEWRGECVLEEQPVAGITPFLTNPNRASGKPFQLKANEKNSFIGSITMGIGFVLTPEEAATLIAKNPKNKAVLFPYLNGEDLNSRPDQSPSRWVINFHNWPLERNAEGSWFEGDEKQIKLWLQSGRVPKDYPESVATDFPDCLAIVADRVKPERDKLKSKNDSSAQGYAKYWWLFGRRAIDLYTTIIDMERVLTLSLVNNHLGFDYAQSNIVFAHRLVVFPLFNSRSFAILQSHFHYHWAWNYSSTLRRDINYSPSDCFETFPFPEGIGTLETIGEQYHAHRQSIMRARQEGLTKTYNRFHHPEETAADIQRLRALHQAMDEAVAAAYGWTDIALGHDFHETKQGVRFTIQETARREVLDRLLELNHRRYAEEVAQGLHEKKSGSRKSGVGSRKKGNAGAGGVKRQPELFAMDAQGDLFE